jgi:ryanodine receptor 2
LKIVQYVLILCALSLYSETVDNIKSLYSPYFPLDVVKNFVMTALDEAVQINQVHNRDPIGGSNENLFL